MRDFHPLDCFFVIEIFKEFSYLCHTGHIHVPAVANILKQIFIMKSYLIVVILGLLISCSQDEPEFEKVNYEFIALNCLFQEDSEFIIKTENEYIQMATQIYRYGRDCADTTQAPFEFKDYILMGKYTKSDMNDRIYLDVYKNKTLKRIIYKIKKDIVPGPNNNGGFGNIYSSGMNWVKIPKPPEDYEIIIEYKEY